MWDHRDEAEETCRARNTKLREIAGAVIASIAGTAHVHTHFEE